MKRNFVARIINSLMILVLMGVILGAFYQQYAHQELPCPLCLLQRIAMIGIALGLFLNLKYGIQPMYYGMALLFATFGRTVSLRQIALHVCPGFPTFGIPVFGLELYAWAFLVFYCAAVAIAIALFLYPSRHIVPEKLSGLEKFAGFLLLAVTVVNVFMTFNQCGLGPCEDVPWPQTPPGEGIQNL